jgi:hypothetical protein
MLMATFTGGCACGAVRYQLAGAPIVQNHCHCVDCRRRSGTGHGSYLTFRRDADSVVTGELRAWTVVADSGSEKSYHFCSRCGAPVWVTFSAAPELAAVHAGSLDDPSAFAPQMVTYRVRALPWDVVDAALPAFDRMPPG